VARLAVRRVEAAQLELIKIGCEQNSTGKKTPGGAGTGSYVVWNPDTD